MNLTDLKKNVVKELVQAIGIPAAGTIAFFVWLYQFINADVPRVLIFPVSGIILAILYLFSEPVYSGILLVIVSLIGVLAILLTPSPWVSVVFLLEIAWLWGMFLALGKYRKRYRMEQNRITEQQDVLDTQTSLLQSRILEHEDRCRNLNERIRNYQSLGRMVQMLGSTLEEDKMIPLIERLAGELIGRGGWRIKRAASTGFMVKYVKTQKVPLLITNLAQDERFLMKHPHFASAMAVPLEANDTLWGVLEGIEHKPHAFDEDDLRLVSVLSGMVSLALNNVRLYTRTQELSITDGLTGLYVQNYFKERLREEMLRSRRHDLPLTIAIMDVDRFKVFNDTFGHAAGDVVLRLIAGILRKRLRETDVVCRYGGEEFALMMLQTELRDATRICDDVRKAIAAEKFFLPVESFRPVQTDVTISIGIAPLEEPYKNDEDFLKAADSGLYTAKKNGRNRVEVYHQ